MVERRPLRSMRIPDREWEAAKRAAAVNSESVTTVVRRELRAYVKATEDKEALRDEHH